MEWLFNGEGFRFACAGWKGNELLSFPQRSHSPFEIGPADH